MNVGQTIVGINTQVLEQFAELVEELFEVDGYCVAKHDQVRLSSSWHDAVRKQVGVLGIFHLFFQRTAQPPDAHEQPPSAIKYPSMTAVFPSVSGFAIWLEQFNANGNAKARRRFSWNRGR